MMMAMYDDKLVKILLDRIVELASERAEMRSAMHEAQNKVHDMEACIKAQGEEIASMQRVIDESKKPWGGPELPTKPMAPTTLNGAMTADDMPF